MLNRKTVETVQDVELLRRIGFVGRLSAGKGVDVLLRAMAELMRFEPRVELTIVGDGAEANRVRMLAQELGVLDSVKFAGFIVSPDELVRVLSDIGIVVVPSRTEGVPLALLEAMALGRAVVATRVGGIPSVLEDARNGLLVPPEDPQALSVAILRLVQDPALAFRLARAAREDSVRYTVQRQAQAMIVGSAEF
jgi:glycosyltransferase involved in cell wall biosynthesis